MTSSESADKIGHIFLCIDFSMPITFLAFIDESGDDGLTRFRVPLKNGGSSSWLVLSACIMRRNNDLESVRWRDEIRNAIFRSDKRSRVLHFSELEHSQKVTACTVMASKPIRVVTVLVSKRSILEGTYIQKNQLYFHMARYLIERISWLCRDLRPRAPEGDGRVAITFSRRGGMSYDAFADYIEQLKQLPTQIHWPVIDAQMIRAIDHSTSASLQFADIAASAFAGGVEPDRFGNCELRYAQILRPIVYVRRGNFLSYGVKCVPPHSDCGLNEQQSRFFQMFE